MWKTKTPGIPDELFERDEKVPITKEEVRVIQIAKGRLKPGMTVFDIGCGSGSVSGVSEDDPKGISANSGSGSGSVFASSAV